MLMRNNRSQDYERHYACGRLLIMLDLLGFISLLVFFSPVGLPVEVFMNACHLKKIYILNRISVQLLSKILA